MRLRDTLVVSLSIVFFSACGNDINLNVSLGDGNHIALQLVETTKQALPKPDKIIKMVSVDYATISLRANGDIYTWGDNRNGVLGQGDTRLRKIPTRINATHKWKDIALGNFHALAISEDGTLWAWGNEQTTNYYAGTITPLLSTTPFMISAQTDWLKVEAGNGVSFALKKDGTLWSWGTTLNGTLGLGLNDGSYPFITRIGTKLWKDISVTARSCLALRSDGTLWAWGENDYGQVGLGDDSNTSDILTPSQVGVDADWRTIGLGYKSAYAIKQDGTLWSWGSNEQGQLGNLTKDSLVHATPRLVDANRSWEKIYPGVNKVFATQNDGTVWVWGSNVKDTFAIENATNLSTAPLKVGFENITFISAKSELHTHIVDQNGSVWAIGSNDYAELGINNTLTRTLLTPLDRNTFWNTLATGYAFTVGITMNGDLYAWGLNDKSQLGDGRIEAKGKPERINSASTWLEVSAGEDFAFAKKDDGTLWGWGDNSFGQLGLGHRFDVIEPTLVDSSNNIKKISAGNAYALFLDNNGVLKSVGQNSYGQLGVGTTDDNTTLNTIAGTWKDVAACGNFAIGINSNDELYTWGKNSAYQLGTGNTTQSLIPVRIDANVSQSIACSSSTQTRFAAVIRADGTLWTWGSGSQGELGQGFFVETASRPKQVGSDKDWSKLSVGVTHVVALKKDGSVWSWGDLNALGESSDVSSPKQIIQGNDFVDVYAGYKVSFFLKKDGTVYVLGANNHGEAGIGTGGVPIRSVTHMEWAQEAYSPDFSLAINGIGKLWSKGKNSYGQLGLGDLSSVADYTRLDSSTTWSDICTGDDFSVGIQSDGSLWAWGHNDRAQLSVRKGTNALLPRKISSVYNWKKVSCGARHAIALNNQHQIFSWGDNSLGQVGSNTLKLDSSVTLTQIGRNKSWSDIIAFDNQSYAQQTNARVWAVGDIYLLEEAQ